MAGRDNPFDMQIKLLMIGDSGEYEAPSLPLHRVMSKDYNLMNAALFHMIQVLARRAYFSDMLMIAFLLLSSPQSVLILRLKRFSSTTNELSYRYVSAFLFLESYGLLTDCACICTKRSGIPLVRSVSARLLPLTSAAHRAFCSCTTSPIGSPSRPCGTGSRRSKWCVSLAALYCPINVNCFLTNFYLFCSTRTLMSTRF